MTGRRGLGLFLAEAVVGTTMAFLLLSALLVAALRGEREAQRAASHRAAEGLLLGAVEAHARGLVVVPVQDDTPLVLEAEPRTGRLEVRFVDEQGRTEALTADEPRRGRPR